MIMAMRQGRITVVSLIGWMAILMLVVGVTWEIYNKIKEPDSGVIDAVPSDGVYSETAGAGGSYEDPFHGFFVVEPPRGFKIEERRDKITIVIQPARPHAGEELPRSWVDFKRGGATIGAIARKTYEQDIEKDFDFVKDEYKSRGARILLDRYVTIDGVKGGEYIIEVNGLWFHGIKYKKYGIDHSLTLGGRPREFRRFQKDFLFFARCYRSLEAK